MTRSKPSSGLCTSLKRGELVFLAMAILLFSAMPSRGEPITIAHAQGTTVVSAPPKVVLTLDLASLETLDAIGAEVTGVVGDHMPAHLSKYKDAKYAKIGTLFEPDYETINAIKPDLIIVAARSSPKYKDLSRIAPTIDLSTDDGAFLASAFRNARTLGRIFRKESEIEARIARIEAHIQVVRGKARSSGSGLIILATGGRLSAYGPRSRFGTLHSDFGIVPAVEKLDTAIHGQGVSFELILKANPDWLFIVDRDAAVGRGGQPAAKLLDNQLVARTNAWKKGQVAYLDPVRWYLVGGGIVSLQANVDQIAQALDAAP